MAGPKEKLLKFNGDGMTDPVRHCKTCETIWTVNGVTDTDDWVRQFLATLRGVAIDWFICQSLEVDYMAKRQERIHSGISTTEE